LKKQSKLSELRWPIGIILSIFGLIALSIWTIQQANIKPVVMDDYYLESYQNVDTNINDILEKQMAFDKKYLVDIKPKAFVVGENSVEVTLLTKTDNKPVTDANITVKITKPDTDKYDKVFNTTTSKGGTYRFGPFAVEKIGRWQIMTKVITPDQLASFSKTEVNATK
jgi:hypothetical protein